VGPAHHLRPADQPPAAVSGNEQTIQSMPVPAFFTQDQSSPGNCWNSIGAPQALSVGGSATIVSWTASPAPDTSCSTLPTMAAVTYQGNGLRTGTGTDTSFGGAPGTVAGASTAVVVVEQWPVSGQTVYVWNGLPSGSAYVTYSSQGTSGTSLYWEQPLAGTAAFLVPQPFAQGLPAPLPVMTAYDAAGEVLGTGKL
jgi:hypothetical protein